MTPDTLAQIHAAAFTTDRSWSAQEFQTLQNSPHTHVTATPAGFALWRSVAGEAELLTIAVHPTHQNKGLGRQLMSRWMAQAASSADTALLEVAADNSAARKLYVHFGFQIVAIRKNYYSRPSGKADAVLMRAPLPFSVP